MQASHHQPIVTSGDEAPEDMTDGGGCDDDSETDSSENNDGQHPDDLYDEHADNEDEAYVYKNLRGGVYETVAVQQPEKNANKTMMQVLKPRNSDAVLSCPSCFNIVCMDCQRHERYPNQYRAMFVIGICVHWDQRLVYNDLQQALVEVQPSSSSTTTSHSIPDDNNKEYFYKVCCANCQTQVAALDMTDEVYHFYGCLASS